jgi:Flp pilus assembly protein TadG
MFVAIGCAVDYGVLQGRQTKLQAATDASSLAAAHGLGMADAQTENVSSVVQAVVNSYFGANDGGHYDNSAISVQTQVVTEPLEVHVKATQTIKPPFGLVFGHAVRHVVASSVARVAGRPNICVLGLDPSESGTISLEVNARVTGNDCAVFSNSIHTNGLKAKYNSSLTASLICSRGGKDGSQENFSPEPILDCPGFEDPLAMRPEPTVGECIDTNLVINGGSHTLDPGTYCNGLSIKGGASVRLNPGIYIMKDGPLSVKEDAAIEGEHVGFYFTGKKAVFDFAACAEIVFA